MPNKCRDAKKEDQGGVITWRFLMELCQGPETVTDEAASGAVDGANKVFAGAAQNWVKSDGSAAEVADVTAKVDGTPVTVDSVDADAGSVTLQTAPASGAVTISYGKCKGIDHKEIVINGADMTDKDDANEAKTLRDTQAGTLRTAYLAQVAAEPARTDQPSLTGNVTL